jgi:hypothetical protein
MLFRYTSRAENYPDVDDFDRQIVDGYEKETCYRRDREHRK